MMGQSMLVIGNREMNADQEETGITEVSLLGVFFSESAHRSCAPKMAKATSQVDSQRCYWFEGKMGSWRVAEAWHWVEGLEPLKRGLGRLLVKV